MLFLVEFAPLLLFIGVYFTKGMYAAIGVLMLAMPISLALKYKMTGKLDKMLMWSTVFLLLFGGASLYLQDQRFFYWKPTALYWVMAVCVFGQSVGWRETAGAALFRSDRRTADCADFGRADAATESNLGRVFLAGRFAEHLGRLQLPRARVGQLQGLRPHRDHARFHVRASLLDRFQSRIADRTPASKRGSALKRFRMMWYAIIASDVENSLERRLAVRDAHLARLRALVDEGRLLTAGPHPAIDSEDPGPAGFSGSLIVAEFESLEAAQRWADADPYIEAGVYADVIIKPFRRVLP